MPSCPRCGAYVPSKPGGASCPKCGEYVPEKEITYPESPDKGDLVLKKEPVEIGKPIDCQRVMLQRTRACPKAKISFPQDVVKLMKEMKDYDRERAMILALDRKNNVVGIENISTGSASASIVHPREAIKGSLLVNASHVIFVHNHPSGDPMPSQEDIDITRKLRGAFELVGIDMLDSIIIGRDGFYSRKQEGLWNDIIPRAELRGNIMERGMKGNIMERGMNEACEVAVMAALDTIKSHCGDGYTIHEPGLFEEAIGMPSQCETVERELKYNRGEKERLTKR